MQMRSMLVVLLVTGVSVFLAGEARADTLYGIDTTNDTLITIDTTTGTFNTVGNLGVSVFFGGLAFDSGGNLYALATVGLGCNVLYSINPTTGAATSVGPCVMPTSVYESLTIVGTVGYTQDVMTNTLYQLDLTTTAVTPIGGYTDATGRITGLTQIGSQLFGSQLYRQRLVAVNATTGGISVIGSHSTAGLTGLAYAGGSYWATDYEDLYSIHPLTAAATLQYSGPSGMHITALTGAYIPPSVPEPATLALFGLGAAGLAVRRRVRRRSRAA